MTVTIRYGPSWSMSAWRLEPEPETSTAMSMTRPRTGDDDLGGDCRRYPKRPRATRIKPTIRREPISTFERIGDDRREAPRLERNPLRNKLITLFAAALVLTACGGNEEPAADIDADPAAHSLTTTESDLGTILVDEEGSTLYVFIPDNQGASTCYDDCAGTWPALTGTVEADDGVDAAVGTGERTDGETQATLNGWPLYYFAGDTAPGDTAGQGVGDVWFVVDPAGNPIEGP